MKEDKEFEVIIIGGSYAGLSAAMALGRSLRRVLIIDSGKPCNRQTPHSQNFITQDGEKPAQIAAKAREQVLKYETITFLEGLATAGKKTDPSFEITIQDGSIFYAKKLIFATGITDIMPEIKGFAECWGISAVHCPYCHGYEFRDQKTGIMANGEKAYHLATLVHNLTKHVSILTSGKAEFTAEQMDKLNRNKIEIIEKEISGLDHENGNLKQVLFKDGSSLPFRAVYAALAFRQHTDIPEALGCELTEHGHLKVNAFQQTTIDGIYACGDNCSMMRSVANAVYSGNLTGALVNKGLVDENF